jgi:hypothetical protein
MPKKEQKERKKMVDDVKPEGKRAPRDPKHA